MTACAYTWLTSSLLYRIATQQKILSERKLKIDIVQQGMNHDKPYFSNISGVNVYGQLLAIPFYKQDINGYKIVWYLF